MKKLKSKEIGARVQVREVLLSITPKEGWKYAKNVLGTIVSEDLHRVYENNIGYEQYYYTSTGANTYPRKFPIENDTSERYAIKLDDGLVDIAGNNIMVIRLFDMKLLDELPEKIQKTLITKREYNKAMKIIDKYNKQKYK